MFTLSLNVSPEDFAGNRPPTLRVFASVLLTLGPGVGVGVGVGDGVGVEVGVGVGVGAGAGVGVEVGAGAGETDTGGALAVPVPPPPQPATHKARTAPVANSFPFMIPPIRGTKAQHLVNT